MWGDLTYPGTKAVKHFMTFQDQAPAIGEFFKEKPDFFGYMYVYMRKTSKYSITFQFQASDTQGIVQKKSEFFGLSSQKYEN